MEPVAPEMAGSGDPMEAVLSALVEEVVQIFKGDSELSEKKKAIGELLSKSEKVKTIMQGKTEKKPTGGEGDDPPAASEALVKEMADLREQLDQFKAKEAVAGKLAKAKLPQENVPKALYEQLLVVDDAKQNEIIESLQKIGLGNSRFTSPQSRDGGGSGGNSQQKPAENVSDFVSKLKHA